MPQGVVRLGVVGAGISKAMSKAWSVCAIDRIAAVTDWLCREYGGSEARKPLSRCDCSSEVTAGSGNSME
jgi:hypothetical protein